MNDSYSNNEEEYWRGYYACKAKDMGDDRMVVERHNDEASASGAYSPTQLGDVLNIESSTKELTA